ncbi:hypothetical protein OIO90_004372 [Microbotryomycetes sp. JL221]|nr:hypothetical protein OIO90_004372 [Microbotryomycetes sp. JL221]
MSQDRDPFVPIARAAAPIKLLTGRLERGTQNRKIRLFDNPEIVAFEQRENSRRLRSTQIKVYKGSNGSEEIGMIESGKTRGRYAWAFELEIQQHRFELFLLVGTDFVWIFKGPEDNAQYAWHASNEGLTLYRGQSQTVAAEWRVDQSQGGCLTVMNGHDTEFVLMTFLAIAYMITDSRLYDCNREEHQQTFESVSAGASLTYPMQCSALRKGGHVVIKGRPCKIIDMSTSKTGKHGHAKVHLVATDIFTQRKYEDISPSTHNMDVPNVSRQEYQLINIDDGFLNMMTTDGTPKDDVRVPEGEIGDQIQAAFDDGQDLSVTVISAMGTEQAIAFKNSPNN